MAEELQLVNSPTLILFQLQKKRKDLPKNYFQINRMVDSDKWEKTYDEELKKLSTIGGCTFISKHLIPKDTEILSLVELFSKKCDSIKKDMRYKVRITANGKSSKPLQPTYSPVSN
eukprot:snap_masked-scaffold_103-processed-gene-0.24-mRNA-1 protein AED:1.00 eAED:1.00 QI:0/-1/0/0/-1/1/1/0/115